jgi:phosphoglycolate phosphatase-like HAD superfamily hydrolase
VIDSKAKIATPKDLPEVFKQNGYFNQSEAVKLAKEKGFDGIDLDAFEKLTPEPGESKELQIFNPDILKTKSQLKEIWEKAQKVVPEQPIQKKISADEYNKYKKTSDETFESIKDYANEINDPEYKKQIGNIRPESVTNYVAQNGIDDLFEIARGAKFISPDSGFTAPYAKEWLIKSGKLTDDQVARLLRSKAVESFAGSSLQSVSPLQSFMNKANEAIKKTYQNKIVANKKTVRSLFEGLEC